MSRSEAIRALPGWCAGSGWCLRRANCRAGQNLRAVGAGTTHRGRLAATAQDRFAGAAVLEPLAKYSISGLRIAPHGRSWLNFVPRLRAGPARSICCASVWKRSSESGQPGEDVALAAEGAGCSPQNDLQESAHSAVQALAGPDDEAGGALAMLYAARKAFESAVSPRRSGGPAG